MGLIVASPAQHHTHHTFYLHPTYRKSSFGFNYPHFNELKAVQQSRMETKRISWAFFPSFRLLEELQYRHIRFLAILFFSSGVSFLAFCVPQLLSEVLIPGPPGMLELSGVLAVADMLTGRIPAANNDRIQSPPLRDLLAYTLRVF